MQAARSVGYMWISGCSLCPTKISEQQLGQVLPDPTQSAAHPSGTTGCI